LYIYYIMPWRAAGRHILDVSPCQKTTYNRYLLFCGKYCCSIYTTTVFAAA
jgi:hypothetical protein